jgi:hypothetical protein
MRSSNSRTNENGCLLGVPHPTLTVLSDTTANEIQHSLTHLDEAAATARSFLRASTGNVATDTPPDEVAQATDNARRCLDLYLSARRITGICRRHLRISPPEMPSSWDNQSPPLSLEAVAQATGAAADADRAFADLIDQLASVICSDDDLLYDCIADLFDRLTPRDLEGWQLISAVARKRSPYKWIFADERITADAAAFAFLQELGSDADRWVEVALERIFEKTGPS